MPRSTVCGLLLYIAFACLMLALARLEFIAGCLVLLVGVVIGNLLLPTQTWRYAIYGGVAGIAAAMLVLVWYLNIYMTGPRNKSDGRREAFFATRPYVVQVGALVGGTVGLAICKARARTDTFHEPADVKPPLNKSPSE